jgi:hypothetical protein
MRIHGSKYAGMDWADALSKHNQPPADVEKSLAEAASAPLTVESELEAAGKTEQIMFDLPVDPAPQKQAIEEASRKAIDDAMIRHEAERVNQIKDKLSSHGIDPVSLGIVSKAEWNAINDISKAEELAKTAALAAEAHAKKQWERNALAELTEKPKNYSHDYDPATTRDGKIASMASPVEDVVAHNPNAPLNSVSMSDLERLDRLAEAENAHDASIRASREEQARREAAHADWRTEQVPEEFNPLKGASVTRSAGGNDSMVSPYRAPANQVSMADNVSGATPAEIKERLSALFAEKIVDSRQQTREANEERRASIQREAQSDDRSWEKVDKGVSTKDISRRLSELWMPQSGEESAE